MVKTRVIGLRVIEGPNARDQIVFCAFHSFLVEVQTKAAYMYMRCVRNNNLDIRIVARNNKKHSRKNAVKQYWAHIFFG